MKIVETEIVVKNGHFYVTAAVESGSWAGRKNMTLVVKDTIEEAEHFIMKCNAYNDGVYDEEVFNSINSNLMP